MKDVWGILIRKNSPLADKEYITPKDLQDKPLIFSRHALKNGEINSQLKRDVSKLNIAATYNLLYNASLMVDEELGYAFSLDKIINVSGTNNLCFKRFIPKLEVGISIIWKKYQIFSKDSEKFLEKIKEVL